MGMKVRDEPSPGSKPSASARQRLPPRPEACTCQTLPSLRRGTRGWLTRDVRVAGCNTSGSGGRASWPLLTHATVRHSRERIRGASPVRTDQADALWCVPAERHALGSAEEPEVGRERFARNVVGRCACRRRARTCRQDVKMRQIHKTIRLNRCSREVVKEQQNLRVFVGNTGWVPYGSGSGAGAAAELDILFQNPPLRTDASSDTAATTSATACGLSAFSLSTSPTVSACAITANPFGQMMP